MGGEKHQSGFVMAAARAHFASCPPKKYIPPPVANDQWLNVAASGIPFFLFLHVQQQSVPPSIIFRPIFRGLFLSFRIRFFDHLPPPSQGWLVVVLGSLVHRVIFFYCGRRGEGRGGEGEKETNAAYTTTGQSQTEAKK